MNELDKLLSEVEENYGEWAIKKLIAIVKELKESNEFYADRWTYYKRLKDGSREENLDGFEMIDRDREKITEDWNGQKQTYNFSSPGKRARNAIAKSNAIAKGES